MYREIQASSVRWVNEMKNREKHDDKTVYEMYEMYGGKNGILQKEG